jgi:SOS response regulatory protein OraA/RecX
MMKTPLRINTEGADAPLTDKEKMKNQALKYLAVRPYFAEELRRKLLQKGGKAPLAEEVLTDLHHDGLLNDANAAQGLIRVRKNKGKGRNYIRRELLFRGLSDDESRRLIEDNYSSLEEKAGLRRLRKKKYLYFP